MALATEGLLDRDWALPVPQLVATIPALPGLYAIWIRNLRSLPPELVEYQRTTARVRGAERQKSGKAAL